MNNHWNNYVLVVFIMNSMLLLVHLPPWSGSWLQARTDCDNTAEECCDSRSGRPRNCFGSDGGLNVSCPTKCSFTRKYLNSASRPRTSGESRNVKLNRHGVSIHSGQSSMFTLRTACWIKRHGPPNRITSPDRSVTVRTGSLSLCLKPKTHEAPTQRFTTG